MSVLVAIRDQSVINRWYDRGMKHSQTAIQRLYLRKGIFTMLRYLSYIINGYVSHRPPLCALPTVAPNRPPDRPLVRVPARPHARAPQGPLARGTHKQQLITM